MSCKSWSKFSGDKPRPPRPIESGCMINTGIKPIIEDTKIVYDVSESAKRIMEDIIKTRDKWVFQNLPTEVLKMLHEKVIDEIIRRKLEGIK